MLRQRLRKRDRLEYRRQLSLDRYPYNARCPCMVLRESAGRYVHNDPDRNGVEKRVAVFGDDAVMPPEQPVRVPPDPRIQKHTLTDLRQPGDLHFRAGKRPERAFFDGNLLPDAERGMMHARDLLKPIGKCVRTHAAKCVRLLRRKSDLLPVNAFRQSLCAHNITSTTYEAYFCLSCVLY